MRGSQAGEKRGLDAGVPEGVAGYGKRRGSVREDALRATVVDGFAVAPAM
jgi:hypothetical protein